MAFQQDTSGQGYSPDPSSRGQKGLGSRLASSMIHTTVSSLIPRLIKSAKILGMRLALNARVLHIPRLTKSTKSLDVRLALNACVLHIPRLTKSAKSLDVRLVLNACVLHIDPAQTRSSKNSPNYKHVNKTNYSTDQTSSCS